jgi:hypothetical protein
MPKDLLFAHSTNPDGTTTSICTQCLQRVMTADTDSILAGYEVIHVCNPADLQRLQQDDK